MVGLGTGSTAYYAIVELGRRIREDRASFTGIPTSYAAESLARQNGIPLTSLRNVEKVDIAVDGADEIDPQLDLIKGYGGALTLEKMVDSYADCFIVIADDSKLVDKLGHAAFRPLGGAALRNVRSGTRHNASWRHSDTKDGPRKSGTSRPYHH